MRPLPRSARAFSASLAAAAAPFAGCGGGEDETARAVTLGAGETLEVAGDEYSFDPGNVVVEGGSEVEIALDNRGSLAHNLKILDGETEIGGTPTFQGGETRTATLELEPGAYRLVCTVGDHEELGMVGELDVK